MQGRPICAKAPPEFELIIRHYSPDLRDSIGGEDEVAESD